MSLLTVVQTALKEIPGFEVPDTIAGNDNATAVLSLALANRSLKQVSADCGLNIVSRRQEILTVTDQEEYALPVDFYSAIALSWWDNSNRWRMIGAATANQWEFYKNREIEATVRRIYRIFRSETSNDNVIHIFPTPTADGEKLRYEYYSNYLVEDNGGTAQKEYTADDDVSLLDEDLVIACLKWRLLQAKGLPYAEEMADYENLLERYQGLDGGQVTSLGGASP